MFDSPHGINVDFAVQLGNIVKQAMIDKRVVPRHDDLLTRFCDSLMEERETDIAQMFE